jgi:uncharacterized membrane protein YsdA (DUF1294 family)/cold shock CspA family protein
VNRFRRFGINAIRNCMRYQGKITSWKDDQGFGFITPNGGGEPVFLHIKAFSRRGRRPIEGEIVTYVQAMDAKGRARAEGVAFVESTKSRVASSGVGKSGGRSPLLAVLFFVFVGALALAGRLPPVVVGVYAGASLLAFVVYAWDKSAAQGGHWRTAESTLHMIALFGGWPGALVAQRVLRHKSSKASFQTTFWATVLINCGVLGWLLTAKGAVALRSVLAGVV